MKTTLISLCFPILLGCTPSSQSTDSGDSCPKYDRDLFGYGETDYDGDGCFARAELLISRSLVPVEMDPESRCRVASGKWLDAYSEDTVYDADSVQIDHVVALNEAHQSGAHAWEKSKLVQFGNLDTLDEMVIAKSSTNISKSDLDISEWVPQGIERQKKYADKWVKIKMHWGLSIDSKEADAIRSILGEEATALLKMEPEFDCPD